MENRVVVTGLGCVSPLGNDVTSTWDACANGKSGIGRITHFDPAALRCQIAGEIKDSQLPDIIPQKEAKKMDLFMIYFHQIDSRILIYVLANQENQHQ